jgi:hypothetical protein
MHYNLRSAAIFDDWAVHADVFAEIKIVWRSRESAQV